MYLELNRENQIVLARQLNHKELELLERQGIFSDIDSLEKIDLEALEGINRKIKIILENQ